MAWPLVLVLFLDQGSQWIWYYLAKEWDVCMPKYLPVLSLRLACLHILSILPMVALWSQPMSFNAAIRMLSAMPNSFGIPSNSSFIFLWNISAADATPNVSCICLYLPKGKEKWYDGSSSSFQLWYPELTLMSMRSLTPTSLSKMLLRVRPMWIGLIMTLFNLAGSRHNQTLPFAFGTSTKLLTLFWCFINV